MQQLKDVTAVFVDLRVGAVAVILAKSTMTNNYDPSTRRPWPTRLLPAALLVLSLFIAGCGGPDPNQVPPSRLTQANYDAIRNGMSKVDLITLIGRWQETVPDTPANSPANPSAPAVEHYRWMHGSQQIDVVFQGDKVISKSSAGLSNSK